MQADFFFKGQPNIARWWKGDLRNLQSSENFINSLISFLQELNLNFEGWDWSFVTVERPRLKGPYYNGSVEVADRKAEKWFCRNVQKNSEQEIKKRMKMYHFVKQFFGKLTRNRSYKKVKNFFTLDFNRSYQWFDHTMLVFYRLGSWPLSLFASHLYTSQLLN